MYIVDILHISHSHITKDKNDAQGDVFGLLHEDGMNNFVWWWSYSRRSVPLLPEDRIHSLAFNPWRRLDKPCSEFAPSRYYTPLECTSVRGVNRSIQKYSLTCQGRHQHIMKARAVNNASPWHNCLSKWMRLILKWTAVMWLLWTNTSGELHTRDMNGSWKNGVLSLGAPEGTLTPR